MKTGALLGIGIGPGDPELVTLKAISAIGRCGHVFVPFSPENEPNLAYEIVSRYAATDARLHRVEYTGQAGMTKKGSYWDDIGDRIIPLLKAGQDVGFVTYGDPLFYSTYIYVLRSLKDRMDLQRVETVPGISSLGAAAALFPVPLGEGRDLVTIVPVSHNEKQMRSALMRGGTVVLMRIGRRLQKVLDILEETARISDAVFVSKATLPGQYMVSHLRDLRGAPEQTGHLSIILVQGRASR